MKILCLSAITIASLTMLLGCSDMGKPAVSSDEQKRFEHPIKEPPPEASAPPAANNSGSSPDTGK